MAVLVAPATDLWIKTASASVQEAPLPSAVVAVVVAAVVAVVIVVRRKVSCPLLFAKMYMYIFAQLAFCFYNLKQILQNLQDNFAEIKLLDW